MSTELVTRPDAIIEKIANELALIEEKVVTRYTLADAIREGAGHTPQLHGGYLEDGEACALAAGWLAAKARKRI